MGKLNSFILNLREKPFIQSIINDLGGEVFAMGGVVRDLILNKPNKDIDLVVRKVSIDRLISQLQKFGRVDVVGKSFGVIKFIDSNGVDYDVALPRTDKKNAEGGYRGFDVQSDENLPIEADITRRDAKMNAMAININTGKFIDPLGGLKDIENKQISAANPEAFSDDPLRMIRIVAFASRFGFTIELQTMQMIKDNAHRVKEIAPERILTEFDKIIEKGNIILGVNLLTNTGLYEQIFGGIKNTVSPLFADVQTMGEFIYLLAVGTVPSPAEFYKNNLKGDIPTYKEIKALELAFTLPDISLPIIERSTVHNMYLLSPQALQSQIIPMGLQKASEEFQQGKYPKTVNELAVNGQDLMSVGLQGKAVGDMQKSLLLKIYADKVRNSKEDLLALARPNGEVIKEEVKPEDKIEYGCLMLFLDVPIWSKITSVINREDIYDAPGYGIETEPHTTILYGFHDEVTSEDCFNLFKENMPVKPFKIGIKGISFFTGNPKFDVVKFDVESPELTELNEVMKALPHTSAFPDYHPHITIAYVKPGEGQKYVKPFKKNRMLNGNELVYTWKGHKGNDGDKLMLDGSIDESIADKAAEKMFNIPNQSAKQDIQAAGAVQAQEEKPVAVISKMKNGKIDAFSIGIYENPKSLANFGSNTRAIVDFDGNLFIAQENGWFNHGDMAQVLGISDWEDGVYEQMEEYQLLQRIENSNAFGLADSSADFAGSRPLLPNDLEPNQDEYNENFKIVNNILRAAKRKNPQYDFYSQYYLSINTEPVSLEETYMYNTLEPKKSTWNVSGQTVDINFFTDQYYQWNQDRYVYTTTKSVLEFLDNNYPDLMNDEKLKHDLYHKLVDNEILDEEQKQMKNVRYTAVVLDDKSRTALLKRLGNMIPEGWETIAHHMTINMGAIVPEFAKFLGMNVDLNAEDFAADDKVMAVGVAGMPTKNGKPHITLAVNRANGGKPMMSNQLTNWEKLSEPLVLSGKVTEVE
jgi:hypothetical protein